MMPQKSGFELTYTLKKDERTSHIPIILLTAKTDLDSKISGLEKGADAYLAKPFEQKELIVRLRKLLELRQQLQSRYSGQNPTLVHHETTGDLKKEDLFIQKVRGFITENLSNSEYDILRLTRDLGMSRSQVFRKIKALTGTSPALFIRTQRLRESKKLLTTTDLTISEIAYEVGFSTVQYFSDAYLEEFGERPSATRK
jgi:AraC-like DNA-binding protein